MEKHSLVIKVPALHQPWELEIGVLVLFRKGKSRLLLPHTQQSCPHSVNSALACCFVLYQANDLAAKGPNLKGDNLELTKQDAH